MESPASLRIFGGQTGGIQQWQLGLIFTIEIASVFRTIFLVNQSWHLMHHHVILTAPSHYFWCSAFVESTDIKVFVEGSIGFWMRGSRSASYRRVFLSTRKFCKRNIRRILRLPATSFSCHFSSPTKLIDHRKSAKLCAVMLVKGPRTHANGYTYPKSTQAFQ